MRLRTIAAAVAVIVAVLSCVEFAATRNAGVRRMAEARLAVCRKGTVSSVEARPCYEQTRAFCLDAGLERGCGEGVQ